MKKFILIFVLVVIATTLVGCSQEPEKPAPMDRLQFVIEPDPGLIGSFSIKRERGEVSWIEEGSWNSLSGLLNPKIVCFGDLPIDPVDQLGIFRARSDYEWKEVSQGRGTMCLQLKRRK